MQDQKMKTMLEKLEDAAPYNIFYNKIPALKETEPSNYITFKDLLCPSLGKLNSSLQIMSKVDIIWLAKQYDEMNVGSTPLTVLYGEEKPEMEEFADKYLPNVTLHCVEVDGSCKYGNHHSKLGIYLYDDDSLRVVVYTSNLFQQQWDHHNHGFWVSPLCRRLSSASSGESPTNFKSSLIAYLKEYRLSSILDEWIDHVQHADFSDVRVFLVTTVPGSHPATNPKSHLQTVKNILTQHCQLSTDDRENSRWPVIVQTPSLGNFGGKPQTWLSSEFSRAVSSHQSAGESRSRVPLKIVFPSRENVESGIFGTAFVSGGDGLRYVAKIHESQRWLEDYLHQWKADNTGRTKITPHTKIYCRVSPCWTKMAWFMLTTCNLARGPWGRTDTRRGGNSVYSRNWETGVLFLPKFFGEEYFKVKSELNEYVDEKVFPLIYDLPLVKYKKDDKPWTVQALPELSRKTFLSRSNV